MQLSFRFPPGLDFQAKTYLKNTTKHFLLLNPMVSVILIIAAEYDHFLHQRLFLMKVPHRN